MAMTYGSIDNSKNKVTLTFTKGESLVIQEALAAVHSNLVQRLEEYGDDEDGGYDADIRVIDKIIIKFATAHPLKG